VRLVLTCHQKPNPIGGQGGNGAIETATEFMNNLLETRDSRPEGLSGLNTKEISAIFQRVQTARYERAKFLVSLSHRSQALFAYEKPWLSDFIFRVMAPLTGDEHTLKRMGDRLLGSPRLKQLPVPFRPRVIPYNHERPAQPIASGRAKLVRAAFAGGMGVMLYVATRAWRIPIADLGRWGDLGPVEGNWVANVRLDRLLRGLVSLFSYPILSSDPGPRIHTVYFLSQLISPLLIYTIEGHRVGNQATFLALPGLFNLAMQLFGICRIAPVHAIVSAYSSFDSPAGRSVPTEVAKSLVPAITLAYLVPTILMIIPTSNTRAWQSLVAFWQITPPLVSVATSIFSVALKKWRRHIETTENSDQTSEGVLDRYKDKDVTILKSVYQYAFAVQATVHIATLLYSYLNPDISIAKTFFDLPNPLKDNWNLTGVADKISVFFKFDFAIAMSSIIAHNLYTIWDMRRSGFSTTRQSIKAAVAVAIGQVLVGPGATWAGLWSWRESTISGLSTQK
jgi:hypothetical protein